LVQKDTSIDFQRNDLNIGCSVTKISDTCKVGSWERTDIDKMIVYSS